MLIKFFYIVQNIPVRELSKKVPYSTLYAAAWHGLAVKSNRKYYYLVLVMRGLWLAYISMVFDLSVEVQTGSIIILQLGICGLYIKPSKIQNVFSDKLLNKVSFLLETLLLTMKIAILTYTLMLKMGYTDDNGLLVIGWAIIGPRV